MNVQSGNINATLNSLDDWISIPDMRPVFDHQDAYNVRQIARAIVGTKGYAVVHTVAGLAAAEGRQ